MSHSARFSPVAMVVVLAASCTGASGLQGPAAVEPLPPPAQGEGFQLSMAMTVGPQQEAWRCQIISGLKAEGDLFTYVNRAESRQTNGMHHADVATLFFTGLKIEPGQYDCADLYAAHQELMEDAVIIYASQQPEDSLELPTRTAAQLPIDSLYMYEAHFVNVSDKAVDVTSYLNAYTVSAEEVDETIYGKANRDFDINVPPHAENHVEWTRCVFNKDADVIFLSGHTHALARTFTLKLFDGVNVGDVVYSNDDWHSPPVKRFEPLMHVSAGTGFEYSCDYSSNRDTDTVWGFKATDEMCQFGYVFLPGDTEISCDTVATSDGLGIGR